MFQVVVNTVSDNSYNNHSYPLKKSEQSCNLFFSKSAKSCVLVSIVKVPSRLFTNFNSSWPHECIGQGRPYQILELSLQFQSSTYACWAAVCILFHMIHVKDTETGGSSSDDTDILTLSDIFDIKFKQIYSI